MKNYATDPRPVLTLDAGGTNFAKKVLEWSRGRDALEIVDDQISRPAYTMDLAPAILDLIGTDAFGLYHMANEGFCSRYEWAQTVVRLSGVRVQVKRAKSADFPSPADRPAFSALDLFPLKETIGRSLPDWRDATERFLKELRD